MRTSRSGRCRAQWPCVWPGLGTTTGRPGTGTVSPGVSSAVALTPFTASTPAATIEPRIGSAAGWRSG